jgi:hypothetical protein
VKKEEYKFQKSNARAKYTKLKRRRYYTDANGQKQGSINEAQLKTLARLGIITSDTIIENVAGQQVQA